MLGATPTSTTTPNLAPTPTPTPTPPIIAGTATPRPPIFTTWSSEDFSIETEPGALIYYTRDNDQDPRLETSQRQISTSNIVFIVFDPTNINSFGWHKFRAVAIKEGKMSGVVEFSFYHVNWNPVTPTPMPTPTATPTPTASPKSSAMPNPTPTPIPEWSSIYNAIQVLNNTIYRNTLKIPVSGTSFRVGNLYGDIAESHSIDVVMLVNDTVVSNLLLKLNYPEEQFIDCDLSSFKVGDKVTIRPLRNEGYFVKCNYLDIWISPSAERIIYILDSPTQTPTPTPTPTPEPPPKAPVINPMTNQSDFISGTGTTGASVGVLIQNKRTAYLYQTSIVDGRWEIKLESHLLAGTMVSAFVKFHGLESPSKSIYVKPAVPLVYKIYKNATAVKGKATKGSTVFVKISTHTYKGKANVSTGAFAIKIPKISKGKAVSVYCTAGGQTSATRKLTSI